MPSSLQFSRQLIQTAALLVGNCLTDNIDFYMRLHPDTDVNGAFTSYFKYPDAIVRLVCELTYHQFSYYLYQSTPNSIDHPDAISNYTRLLHTASESKGFVARVDNLFLEATDLLKVLQCLCTISKNRQYLIANVNFHKAITNLMLGEGEKEIECALDLLLTYLTEGEMEKEKRKKEQVLKEDGREQARDQLLSHFPEIVHQLKNVASRHGDIKCLRELCSALLWRVQGHPGELAHRSTGHVVYLFLFYFL